MGRSLVVPGGLVGHLRRGLFGELGYAAQELSLIALERGGDASEGLYTEPLRAFDAGRALLDTVGWRGIGEQSDVEIDLALHPLLVLRALQAEHVALVDQLREIPLRRENHDLAAARVRRLEQFVALVEGEVRRLARREAENPLERSMFAAARRPPLRVGSSSRGGRRGTRRRHARERPRGSRR